MKFSKAKEQKQIIRDALKHLKEVGWYNPHISPNGGTCVALAIDNVAGFRDSDGALARFAKTISLKSALRTTIGNWNDDEKRTFAQVEKAMLRAAK